MWLELQHQYCVATREKFPGYLNFHSVVIALANLGVRLSVVEAKELSFIVAPEKSGKIYEPDLHAFMTRTGRHELNILPS